MEREYEEVKVIISRRELQDLEQSSNMLKLQLEEERRKFKESALYCVVKEVQSFFGRHDIFETVYSNSDVVKELSDRNKKLFEENQKLQQLIEKHHLYSNMPLYKRIFYAIKNNYNHCYV